VASVLLLPELLLGLLPTVPVLLVLSVLLVPVTVLEREDPEFLELVTSLLELIVLPVRPLLSRVTPVERVVPVFLVEPKYLVSDLFL